MRNAIFLTGCLALAAFGCSIDTTSPSLEVETATQNLGNVTVVSLKVPNMV